MSKISVEISFLSVVTFIPLPIKTACSPSMSALWVIQLLQGKYVVVVVWRAPIKTKGFTVQTEFKHKASSIASRIAYKYPSIPVLNFKYPSMDDFLTQCKTSEMCFPYPEWVRVMPWCIINLPVKVTFNKIEFSRGLNTQILEYYASCFMLELSSNPGFYTN